MRIFPRKLAMESLGSGMVVAAPRNSLYRLGGEDDFVDRQMGSKNYKDCRVSSRISFVPFMKLYCLTYV